MTATWITKALDDGRAFTAAVEEFAQAEHVAAILEEEEAADPMAPQLAMACRRVMERRAAAQRCLVNLAGALRMIPQREHMLATCARLNLAIGIGVRRLRDEELLAEGLRDLETDGVLLELDAAPRVDTRRDTAPPSPPALPTFGGAP